jgi:FixJ family two-component response regulator
MLRPMSPGPASIAVLDDEPAYRQALSRLLKTHGLHVQPFATSEEFFAAAAAQPFACLLLDLHMPGASGFDVLSAIKSRGLPTPVILMTGHDQPSSATTARALGAVNFLLKPLDETVLLAALHAAVPSLQPPA